MRLEERKATEMGGGRKAVESIVWGEGERGGVGGEVVRS